jgi:WD40 repeat protein/mono/diheme cytochrome c family protein
MGWFRLIVQNSRFQRVLLGIVTCFAACLSTPATTLGQDSKPAEQTPVSYYRQVRPLLQRHCSGCHQPSKAGGKLVITTFEELAKGGENGAGFVPHKPDESPLVEFITGEKPRMPLKAEPLKTAQVDLITRWVAEGAKDDTPPSLQDHISAEHPPVYSNPPVITALAYSPDSKLIAVSGFREILIHNADGSGLVKRLVGRSQRIESLTFSNDGKILAAVGGTPSLFGEVQFWNTADWTARNASFASDVLYGGSFSDDAKTFACGGADNSIRLIKVEDMTLLRKLDPHSDWVLGTGFSVDGKHVVTVSRDMAMKLSIVENGQFVDNITSITPGALKGGLMAVKRHPLRDEFLTGGSDGEPKLYKMIRTQARVIGDDFNRIRGYAPLPGRIFALDFNTDGSKFVVASSTSMDGAVRIYNTDDAKLLFELPGHTRGVFTVDFRPDGAQVATGGFDGIVRFFDVNTGTLVKQLVPVEVSRVVAVQK